MTVLLDFSKIVAMLDMHTSTELAERLSLSEELIERYQTGQIPIKEMQVAHAICLMEMAEATGLALSNELSKCEWAQMVKEINSLEEALMFFTHYKCPFEDLEDGLKYFTAIIREAHPGEYLPWVEELTIHDLVMV